MAAHPSTSPSQVMCLLTYTPRADSASRGYEDWLRAVDNPFFNAIPGIVRYENWKVHTPVLNTLPFAYFDLMYIHGREGIDKVWGNQELLEFAREWTRLWGIVPDPDIDQSPNYHVVICEEIAGPIVPRRTEWALFAPYIRRDDAAARNYDTYLRDVDNPFFNSAAVPQVVSDANWHKTSEVVGTESWSDFDLMLFDGPEQAGELFANPAATGFMADFCKEWGRVPEGTPADNFSAVIAELVASPQKK